MAKKALVNKSDWQRYSQYLVWAAVVAVGLAALGWLGTDIWLGSTQWMVVAAVLAAFGIYARLGA